MLAGLPRFDVLRLLQPGPTGAEREWLRRGFVFFLGLAGMALSLAAFLVLRHQERALARQEFRLQAEDQADLIEHSLSTQASVVSVVAAFYAGSQSVERFEFHDFVENLLPHYRAVEWLGWMKCVSAVEREPFEHSTSNELKRRFQIMQREATGRRAATSRPEYCPLTFLEPGPALRQWLGFDMNSEPQFTAAIARAKQKEGLAIAVDRPLGETDPEPWAIYVFTHVHLEDGPHSLDSGESNGRESPEFSPPAQDHPPEGQPEGCAMAFLRVQPILQGVPGRLEPGKVDTCLMDESPAGERRILGMSVGARPDDLKRWDEANLQSAAVFWKHEIELGGHRFTVACLPASMAVHQNPGWLPWLGLSCGIVITSLAVGFLWLLVERAAHSQVLADEREIELQTMSKSSLNPVIIVDNAGRVQHWNAAAAKVFGHQAGEALGHEAIGMLLAPCERTRAHEEMFAFLAGKDEPTVGQVFEIAAMRKDGAEFPADMVITPFAIRGGLWAVVIFRDISGRKHVEQALRDDHRLMRRLIDLLERDRKLTSYDIHDGLAQQLSAAMMKLDAFRGLRDVESQTAEDCLQQSRKALAEALAEARRLISGLRPPILDESGIVAAIEYLIAECRQRYNVEIEFACDDGVQRLAPPLEISVFRIIQESLGNAARHSGSDRVRVELTSRDGWIVVDVRDWGRGFDPQNVAQGRFGLEGIRERSRLFGGAVILETSPGAGTHLRIELPTVDAAESLIAWRDLE